MMKMFYGLIIMTILMLLVACGSDSEKKPTNDTGNSDPAIEKPVAEVKKQDPVEISIFAIIIPSDEDFQTIFVEPLKKKHPHITPILIPNAKGTRIEDLIAAGQTPDIILTGLGGWSKFEQLDLILEDTSIINKTLNMSRFDKVIVDAVTVNNRIVGVPFVRDVYGLYYNKSIFDKFGVNYPKDGIYWDEVLELSRKLSRTDGGVQYRGLLSGDITRFKDTKGLNVLDPVSNKVTIHSDQWRDVFQLFYNSYTTPGNEPAELSNAGLTNNVARKEFNEGTAAMFNFANILSQLNENPELDWDVAQHPSYRDAPNKAVGVDSQLLIVTKTSKHKEAALQVIASVVDDQTQMNTTIKTGRFTPLASDEVRNTLSKYPGVKGKNYQAFLKSGFYPLLPSSLYEGDTNNILRNASIRLLKGESDLNTTLRAAEEEINALIATKSAQ
jgi:multiple sugar transport system substrate-binding protein